MGDVLNIGYSKHMLLTLVITIIIIICTVLALVIIIVIIINHLYTGYLQLCT
jgi:hypothetical protein